MSPACRQEHGHRTNAADVFVPTTGNQVLAQLELWSNTKQYSTTVYLLPYRY